MATIEQSVNLLAEYILRDRRPTAKGQVAQAYFEVMEALRTVAKQPCPSCAELRRELAQAKAAASKNDPNGE